MALRSSQPSETLDVGELLDELAVKVERVKVLYEQYFMGIERLEPQVARKEIARALLLLQQQNLRNTGLRFRFNMMMQKWNVYTGYWNRTLREIENGTYVRHLAKARRAAEREGRELPAEMQKRRSPSGAFDVSQDLPRRPNSDFDREEKTDPDLKPPLQEAEARWPAPPPPPRRGPMPLPAPTPAPITTLPHIPGMSEPELRLLHQRYVAARQANGESGQIKFELLVSSLAKQVPRLLADPKIKGVTFDVALHDGKTILKATPKR